MKVEHVFAYAKPGTTIVDIIPLSVSFLVYRSEEPNRCSWSGTSDKKKL